MQTETLHAQKSPRKEILRFRKMFLDLTSRWSHCQKDGDRKKEQSSRREDMLRGWRGIPLVVLF